MLNCVLPYVLLSTVVGSAFSHTLPLPHEKPPGWEQPVVITEEFFPPHPAPHHPPHPLPHNEFKEIIGIELQRIPFHGPEHEILEHERHKEHEILEHHKHGILEHEHGPHIPPEILEHELPPAGFLEHEHGEHHPHDGFHDVLELEHKELERREHEHREHERRELEHREHEIMSHEHHEHPHEYPHEHHHGHPHEHPHEHEILEHEHHEHELPPHEHEHLHPPWEDPDFVLSEEHHHEEENEFHHEELFPEVPRRRTNRRREGGSGSEGSRRNNSNSNRRGNSNRRENSNRNNNRQGNSNRREGNNREGSRRREGGINTEELFPRRNNRQNNNRRNNNNNNNNRRNNNNNSRRNSNIEELAALEEEMFLDPEEVSSREISRPERSANSLYSTNREIPVEANLPQSLTSQTPRSSPAIKGMIDSVKTWKTLDESGYTSGENSERQFETENSRTPRRSGRYEDSFGGSRQHERPGFSSNQDHSHTVFVSVDTVNEYSSSGSGSRRPERPSDNIFLKEEDYLTLDGSSSKRPSSRPTGSSYNEQSSSQQGGVSGSSRPGQSNTFGSGRPEVFTNEESPRPGFLGSRPGSGKPLLPGSISGGESSRPNRPAGGSSGFYTNEEERPNRPSSISSGSFSNQESRPSRPSSSGSYLNQEERPGRPSSGSSGSFSNQESRPNRPGSSGSYFNQEERPGRPSSGSSGSFSNQESRPSRPSSSGSYLNQEERPGRPSSSSSGSFSNQESRPSRPSSSGSYLNQEERPGRPSSGSSGSFSNQESRPSRPGSSGSYLNQEERPGRPGSGSSGSYLNQEERPGRPGSGSLFSNQEERPNRPSSGSSGLHSTQEGRPGRPGSSGQYTQFEERPSRPGGSSSGHSSNQGGSRPNRPSNSHFSSQEQSSHEQSSKPHRPSGRPDKESSKPRPSKGNNMNYETDLISVQEDSWLWPNQSQDEVKQNRPATNYGDNKKQSGTTKRPTLSGNIKKNQHANIKLLPTDSCGVDLGNRIIGGENTQLDEFPWMALLQHSSSDGRALGFGCGGSLISSRYVLTAAHCIKGPAIGNNIRVTKVRLGEFDTSSDVDCQGEICSPPPVDVPVEQIIVHPKYRGTDRAQLNDIALIRLKENVKTSGYISPICLPLDGNQDHVGDKLTVAGWGKTSNGQNGKSSKTKQKVSIPVVTLEECSPFYNRINIQLNTTQMCAGGERGKDSCQGDSGGPLMGSEIIDNQVRWQVHGIVSFGPEDCGIDNVAGVYTKVSEYIDWILDNMKR